ncbi:hypothetical protein DFH09DRAFT_1467798 [Mycena vulgaris]|nr:hypothetical protein DFH09DRAFT_1467798 [Mycena vulgaris]
MISSLSMVSRPNKVVGVLKRIAGKLGVDVTGSAADRTVRRKGVWLHTCNLSMRSERRKARATLSRDGTTHKNINLDSRRATAINQNTEKQHCFLGIGMAINHTSEEKSRAWLPRSGSTFYSSYAGHGRGGGRISSWERLGEEEHRACQNATLTEFVSKIGQEEFDKLLDKENQDVDLFICASRRSHCAGAIKAASLAGAVQGEYRAAVLKSLPSLQISETGALMASFPSWSLPPRRKEVQIAPTPSQTGALVDTIHDSPRHNDGNLLASLAHGHNDASAAISQLQQMRPLLCPPPVPTQAPTAPFATFIVALFAVLVTKRAREVDDTVRNVRHYPSSSHTAPSSSSYIPVPAAPASVVARAQMPEGSS